MLLIPAIDLKDGHCVRLEQGDMSVSTSFGDDPAAMARRWLDAGARRLHLVDLNGAFAGRPVNESAVKAIIKEIGNEIPIQLGGGIRDLDTIERYLDDGLSYIIIGTAAVKSPGFLKDACTAFGGHIIVGLDAKDGKVATDGWSKLTGHEVVDLGLKFQDYGVEGVIYTDIGRDGMLTGINIDATVKLAQALTIPVFASGGLSSIADIEKLCAVRDTLRSSYGHPATAGLNRMHAALSGQLFGVQLKMVQYPWGCDVSHWRSPESEQSVFRMHLSPTDGVHPASAPAAATAKTQAKTSIEEAKGKRRRDGRKDIGRAAT